MSAETLPLIEERVLSRLDSLGPPRSAEQLRALDPSRSPDPVVRLEALRALARDGSLRRSVRQRFSSEALALELDLAERARCLVWQAIEHPSCVECGRLSTEAHETNCLRVA